ncbi:MAG: cation:proton antiporter [Gemmatimonadota bacterium]
MEPFGPAPHHSILLLLIQTAALLITARGLGEISRRLGQPSVIGEILAGILLGPSLLSGVFPQIGEWLLPQDDLGAYLLEVMSLLGVMFLMLITGLETDIPLIRRHARTAIGTSCGGILATFFSGFLLGQHLPDFLLVDPGDRLIFSLFLATAMSISAIPVIAKVLMDLDLIRRDIGQIIIAAGMSDDTTGWILLSIVAGIASGAGVTAGGVLQSVGTVLAFLIISFTAGRWLVKRALDWVQDEVQSEDRLLTLVVFLTFVWGGIAQALQLEAVLGAFIAGILFGQMRRLPDEVHVKLESIALGIFAPIFFAVAGLKVNARGLLEPGLLLITVIVVLVAILGKVVGTYAGARLIGRRDHWTALSFGAGLNARGAMEIIIATIGLSLGVLTQDMFSIIVVMAMTTSLMAPPALRWALQHVEPEKQELERLRQEELARGSLVADIHRVLLPVRLRQEKHSLLQAIESKLLGRLGAGTDLSITLLNVCRPGEKEASSEFLERLRNMFPNQEVIIKQVIDRSPGDAILDEAKKNYDLLILGASEKRSRTGVLFTPLVDYVVRLAPCLTMIVRGETPRHDWEPDRILVPTNGSRAARHAAELAFSLANEEEDEVLILTVVVKGESTLHLDMEGRALERQLGAAHQIVGELGAVGEASGISVETKVRVGRDPESVILQRATEESVDLIILGTSLRPGSDRLFLGPRVERILNNAPCPAIVLNSAGD